MKEIRKLGVFASTGIPGVKMAVVKALDLLRKRGCEIYLESQVSSLLGEDAEGWGIGQVPEDCQLILVFGGDGTFLRASRALNGKRIPLLGINLGGLGFLTVLKLSEMETALSGILDGQYETESRMLLSATLERGDQTIASEMALNDAVIHMTPGDRLVEFIITAGTQFLGRYRADGLIVSTPTGSTAYSMSAGGPILDPSMDALIATPICPHALSLRPVVLPGNLDLSVELGERSGKAMLAIDGQESLALETGDRIRIAKSSDFLPILLPSGFRFYTLLREKLAWGRTGEA